MDVDEPIKFTYKDDEYLCREVDYAVSSTPELDGEGGPIPSVFTAIDDNHRANLINGLSPSFIIVSERFKALYDGEMERYSFPPEARMFFRSAIFVASPELDDDEMYILSKDARGDPGHNSHVRMEAGE